MRLFPTLVALSATSLPLSVALAHAPSPNFHQLYALERSAQLAAASTSSTSTPHSSMHCTEHSHPKRDPFLAPLPAPPASNWTDYDWSVLKRLQPGQMMHGAAAPGMEKLRRDGAGSIGNGREKEGVREQGRERPRRRGVVDSSKTGGDAEQGEGEGETSDLEARGDQYTLIATNPNATTPVSSSSNSSLDGVWTGVSSYYLFALSSSDRSAVLDAIKAGGFKVVRIFVAGVGANNKGSGNAAVNDVEPDTVGTYSDTILGLIDQLMYDCSVRGLKLLIALSDRYALGYWSTDSYAVQLNIVTSASAGAAQISDAASFYTDPWAIEMFDKRMAHIMAHVNSLLGGKAWSDLDSVIYALEPQNEPQGHMTMASSTWACARASYLRSLLPSPSSILISSGGGVTTTDSLGSWATSCDAFDIISVHDYGTSASITAGALASAQNKWPEKKVIMGEWGMTGANKAALVSEFVTAFKAQGISQMYWEVVKPGQASSDFEASLLQALTGSAYYTSIAPASASSSNAQSSSFSNSSATSNNPSSSKSASPTWSTSSSSASPTAQWSESTAAWSISIALASSSSKGSSIAPPSSSVGASSVPPAPSSSSAAQTVPAAAAPSWPYSSGSAVPSSTWSKMIIVVGRSALPGG
ncbi:SPOSA6832_04978 [Sporobolomyces salmonicolor]|uniref:mannan endo-1,4-beta-mannosidase n=1 Tax=Sporidiobolus salmonicolor TaxID=5005 RepID=A0A0D6ETA0_SPOSA|nr:SPOSA6832_04978 [Sporobolomyces salmonicolor]